MTRGRLPLQCESIAEEYEDELLEFLSREADNVKDRLCSKRTGEWGRGVGGVAGGSCHPLAARPAPQPRCRGRASAALAPGHFPRGCFQRANTGVTAPAALALAAPSGAGVGGPCCSRHRRRGHALAPGGVPGGVPVGLSGAAAAAVPQ